MEIVNYYPTIVILSLYNLLSFFIINKYKKKLFFFLIDKPDGIRKLHQGSVLIIGGIFVANYLIFSTIFFYEINVLLYICAASLLIFVIGLIDDCFTLGAYLKLLIITVIIFLTLYLNNELKINSLYFSSFFKTIYLGDFSYFVTTLCILLLINCLNLSDGINGLATGISIIWLIFIYYYSSIEIKLILLPLLFLLTLIFLSIYKGKYFLGDNGSLILSNFTGMVTIYTYNQNLKFNTNIISTESIFILFMVPGVDMFRLFLQRILKGQDPFKGDRNHLHHLLMDKYSLQKSLFIYFSIMIIFIIIDMLEFFKPIYIIFFYCAFYIFFLDTYQKENNFIEYYKFDLKGVYNLFHLKFYFVWISNNYTFFYWKVFYLLFYHHLLSKNNEDLHVLIGSSNILFYFL